MAQANANADKILAGQTAIVTGSGQNLGRGIALALAGAGANIVLNGRANMADLEESAQAILDLDPDTAVMTILGDVSKHEQVEAMVAQALAHFGGVDIAVSNVGLRRHQPLLDISIADWTSVMETSLFSAFYLARAVLPSMKARGYGRIIHISGRDGFFTEPNRAHNVTAKAGMHALAKAIGLEFGPFGITANTIAPALMETRRNLEEYPDFERISRERVAKIPLRRKGTPDDVGRACLYLTDPDSYVNGQLLHLNGGEYLY